MRATETEVIQWLKSLAETSRAITELELEDEGAVDRLEKLQNMQEELSSLLTEPLASGQYNSDYIHGLIQACLESEQDVNRKLKIFRNYVSEQMQELKSLGKSQVAYKSVYTQAEGYFIDFKK